MQQFQSKSYFHLIHSKMLPIVIPNEIEKKEIIRNHCVFEIAIEKFENFKVHL